MAIYRKTESGHLVKTAGHMVQRWNDRVFTTEHTVIDGADYYTIDPSANKYLTGLTNYTILHVYVFEPNVSANAYVVFADKTLKLYQPDGGAVPVGRVLGHISLYTLDITDNSIYIGNIPVEQLQEALESKADLVNGKVPKEQIDDFFDDIIEGFFINGAFYTQGEESPTYLIEPELGKLYIEIDTNILYRWLGEQYELLTSSFTLTKAKVEAVLTGDITSHNHATEIGNHDTSETAHPFLKGKIDEAKAIAEGKSRAIVFATEANLDGWLATPPTFTRLDGKTKADLKIGDNLYIEELDKPDYWWNGTNKVKLETEKVDLTDYAKSDDLATVATTGSYNDLTNTPTQDKIVFLDLTNEEYTSKTLSSNTKNEIANAILGLIEDGEFQTTDIVLRIDGDLKQTLVSYYISNNEEPYIVLQFGANLAYNDYEAPPYKVLIITNSAVTLENAEDYNYNFITRLGYGNADFGSFKHVASARGGNGNYIHPYARTTAPVLYDFVKGELNDKIASLKGQNNGLAELDASGKVPSTQLPSYVDDVLEYAKLADFPATGEDGKIYVAKDTNLTYRWSGSGYTEISASLALGETSSTAYAGDKGKIAYDHSQTAHAPSNAQKNVQSDWNQTTNTEDDYIKNKPSTFPPTEHNHNTLYYQKSETYSKSETDALVGNLQGQTQELKSITTQPSGTFEVGDLYYNSSTKGLYYYTDSAWELTGVGEPIAGVIYSFNGTLYFWNETEADLIQIGGGVDLSNYYTKTEIDAMFDNLLGGSY